MAKRSPLLVLVALLALGVGYWSGSSSPAQEKGKAPAKAAAKWEYKTVRQGPGLGDDDTPKRLNDLGEQGWELFLTHHVPYPNGTVGKTDYIFKREKQ